MTTTQITLVSTALLAFFAAIPAAISAWTKLQEVLRPLLQRRRLKVAILASDEQGKDAQSFLESLRKQGYSEATITRSAPSCAGMRAVLLWCPPATEAAALLDAVQQTAPEATVLLLTYERLDVRLGAGVLLANSTLRLRSDLSALAEASA